MLNQVADGVCARAASEARERGRQMAAESAVAEGPEVAARLAADRAYIDALRRGEEPADVRLGPDWLLIHQSNLSNLGQARRR